MDRLEGVSQAAATLSMWIRQSLRDGAPAVEGLGQHDRRLDGTQHLVEDKRELMLGAAWILLMPTHTPREK